MKHTITRLSRSLFVALCVSVVLGGCANSGTQRASGTASSLSDTRQELAKAREQIDKTNTSLAALSDSGTTDLTAAFNDFSKQVTELGNAAKRVSERATNMRARADEYYAAWQQELESISSDSIRALSAERRDAAVDRFKRVTDTMQEAKDAFDPFMSNLTDIQTFLANDLNAAGVAAASDVLNKATADGVTVTEKVDAVLAELDSIMDEMSTQRSSEDA